MVTTPTRAGRAVAIAVGALLVSGTVLVAPAGAAVDDISTFAGTGAGCPSSACYAGDGGSPTAAVLWNPTGVAASTSGAVYIADARNNGVRVVQGGVIDTVADVLAPYDVAVDDTRDVLYVSVSVPVGPQQVLAIDLSTGTQTVLAGGASGFAGDDGPASAAQFNNIAGIAVGPDGDVYVADKGNQRVRRIDVGVTPATITTVAGTGAAGGDDGAATTVAQLANPMDVAVASDGTVYIADQLTNRIRILSGGNVGSFAGNFTAGFSGDGGPATSAALNQPTGLAVASDGTVLIADSSNNRVRAVAPGGTITTVVGTGAAGNSGDGGPATSATLSFPIGLATTSLGDIYIASQLANTIRQVQGIRPPGPPVDLAGAASSAGVGLTWAAPADDGGSPVVEYVVHRDGTEIGRTAMLTLTDTTAQPGQTYVYSVVAVNDAGSGPAASVSVAVAPLAPPAPPAPVEPDTVATPVSAQPTFTG